MLKFDSGASQQHANPLFHFQDSHAIMLQLRTPIQVSDRYDPGTNTFPPDWYISDHSEAEPPTEYFIQPIEQLMPHNVSMSPFLTISGAPQASAYHTRLRQAALRTIKQHLPWRQRQTLAACYLNIL